LLLLGLEVVVVVAPQVQNRLLVIFLGHPVAAAVVLDF
jgi:hypothetical protein